MIKGYATTEATGAFAAGRQLRLAEIAQTERMDTNAIIEAIRQLGKSEARLWRTLLPNLDLPEGLKVRVKQQNEVADSLKHYWKNFGSYEGFRQATTGMFQPRVQGVIDFLLPHAEENEALADWIASHRSRLQEAFDAVGSIYAEETARILNRIRNAVNTSDPVWAKGRNLGQKAIRALRSTAGVSSVLVGMRREAYVEDVLEELGRPVAPADRLQSWRRLKQKVAETL